VPQHSAAKPPARGSPKLHPLVLIALIVAAAAGLTIIGKVRRERTPVGTPEVSASDTLGGNISSVVIPNWVPIYPGAKVTGGTSKQTRTEYYIWFTISTNDNCQQVFSFYERQLNLAGFSVVKGNNDGEGCMGVLESHGAGGTRSVNLTGGAMTSGTRFGIEVVQRNVGGQIERPRGASQDGDAAVEARIPAWVPVYPGWTPENLSLRQSGPEVFLSFTFTTGDEIRKVLSWYEEKLRQEGFRVSMDVVGPSGALRSNTADNHRSLKIEASNAGPRNVIMFDVRDST